MKLSVTLYRNRESIIKSTIIWILTFILVALPFGYEIATALVLPLIIPIHINYYLIDKYMKKKMYFHYGILVGILVLVFGFIAQGLSSNLIMSRNDFDPILPLLLNEEIVDIVRIDQRSEFRFAFIPFIVMALTTVFKHYREKQLNTIQDLETQRLKSELNMLKHQVNPHFLFNILNNLFSMSSTYGDESTANGIGHLSHLMRYMLYDTNSEKVRLENEIDMLENFIDLQKLRIGKESVNDINIEVNGDTKNKQLPPMLLIPFLENAFKHGYSINNDFFVKVVLSVENEELMFKVENSINKDRESKNIDSSGIGLENVRKRLDLLYKDEYLLKINKQENVYAISLNIPLNN